MLNFTVIWSVLKRNVQSYFSGVLGYLVIVLFVTIAAFCAFSPEFFANNLANLDQLSEIFPILLLPMVPAITMGIWAEEKKLGTDEILFTLPASDVEILLGKYLAALTVYSIALAFSLTQLFVLAWIGNPDWGVVFTTYVGYWLAGAALLSAGMFASALTGSTTVAYVLGVALCAVPVFIGTVAPGNTFIQGLSLGSQLREFSSGLIPVTGVLYFVTLTLFMLYLNMVVITRRHWAQSEKVAMGAQYAVRAVFLAAALVSANFMAEKSTAYFGSRIDMTAQNLYTLSPTTRKVIDTAREKKRPVTIQAFISPEVPQSYVYARKQLVGLLRQYERIGGSIIDLRLVDVQPNSKESREARTLGVEPVRDRSEVGGKEVEQDVYLGVVITSNVGEVVIPFLDGETSMEYELTRSMATVTTRPERLKVGVLETDGLRLSADTPIRSFFQNAIENLEQQYTLTEITRDKLGDIVEAAEQAKSKEDENESNSESGEEKNGKETADKDADDEQEEENPAEDKPDVLIVVQPSSLTQSDMSNLIKYIEQGNPTLLLDDPLPFFPYVFYRPEDLGVTDAPKQERPSPDSGLAWISSYDQLPVPPQYQQQLMQIQRQYSQFGPQLARQMIEDFYERNPQARPKFPPKANGGTASSLLDAIGLEWNNGRVVWDLFNPHPDFTPTWPREVFGETWPGSYGPQENALLFVAPGNGADAAFNPENPISAGLQELFFAYPGSIRKANDSDLKFQPLVTTGPESGVIPWDDLTYTEMVNVEKFDHETQTRKVSRELRKSRLTNKPLVRLNPRPKKSFDQNTHVIAAHVTSDEEGGDKSKINVVFVADIDFINNFYFEQEETLAKPTDNVAFLFNAIEVLAGDDSMVTLRNRRAKPRRLTAIQGEIEKFRRQRSKEQQKAEAKIRKKLQDAREELDKKQEEISRDTELGFVQKFGQLGEAVDVAQQDFEIQREKLEEQLQQTIADLKGTEQQQVDRLENRVRYAAVLLPPIPALLLGLIVLVVRVVNEEKRVVDSRRHA